MHGFKTELTMWAQENARGDSSACSEPTMPETCSRGGHTACLACFVSCRHNHADLQILKNIKGAVEARNSVAHSATVYANAIMHW